MRHEAALKKKKILRKSDGIVRRQNAVRFTVKSLDPSHGVLHDRLKIELGHWPTPCKPKTKCQMHRWVTGRSIEYTKGVCKCSYCQVYLCLSCFQKFHTCAELDAEKQSLERNWKAKLGVRKPLVLQYLPLVDRVGLIVSKKRNEVKQVGKRSNNSFAPADGQNF